MNRIIRATPEQLNRLTKGIIEGEYYPLDTEEKIQHGAAMLMLLSGFELTEEEMQSVGMPYGFMRSALPRTVNGIPMFQRIGFIHKDDWALIVGKLKEYDALLPTPTG